LTTLPVFGQEGRSDAAQVTSTERVRIGLGGIIRVNAVHGDVMWKAGREMRSYGDRTRVASTTYRTFPDTARILERRSLRVLV
jgi:hypothetical protein